MIRGIILFYINIKPTHGYEIQRFLQLSGTETWAKIQSGSIYYAINKLEKEKKIEVLREERNGSRIRKIYQITQAGKLELKKEMREALSSPIVSVGSLKFITEPMLATLEVEEMQPILEKHIKELQNQLSFWEEWQVAKAGEEANRLSKLSFQMSIESLRMQIAWHEELLENLGGYKEQSKLMARTIEAFDFSQYEVVTKEEETKQSLAFAEELKAVLLSDPKNAVKHLDQIIDQLKKQQ